MLCYIILSKKKKPLSIKNSGKCRFFCEKEIKHLEIEGKSTKINSILFEFLFRYLGSNFLLLPFLGNVVLRTLDGLCKASAHVGGESS